MTACCEGRGTDRGTTSLPATECDGEGGGGDDNGARHARELKPGVSI